jgi:hypothetical protein
MRLKLFITGVALPMLFALTGQQSLAQSDLRRVEAGAQFSALRLRDVTEPDPARGFFFPRTFDTTLAGFGGRFTYNITDRIALDSEINFFREEELESGGRKLQGLFGLKAGSRSDKVGVFGKVRPGFVRFESALDCPLGDVSRCGRFGITDFAIDLGGVIELYPTSRTIVRFDLGDTVIFNRKREFITVVPEPGGAGGVTVPLGGNTTHNIQFSVGFGIRF